MPPKQNQARKRAVNNSNSNSNSGKGKAKAPTIVYLNAPRPKPRQKRNTSDNFRNTRDTTSTASGPTTRRLKGVYAMAELTKDPLQLVISPTGIHRFVSDNTALSLAFAANEQYFVHLLLFEFIPELAVTEPGSVHMSPDWDPMDPIPSDSMTMTSNVGYKSGPVTKKLMVHMPNPRTPDGSYTRPMLFTGTNVIERLSDFGSINFRTTGVTASGVIGRLLMHYDISFHLPQVPKQITINPQATINTLTMTVPGSNKYLLNDVVADTVDTSIHANVNISAGTVYSGIISSLTNVILYNHAYKLVTLGSRIFIRAASRLLTTNGDPTGLSSSTPTVNAMLGAMGASRTMEAMYDYYFSGSSGGTIGLDEVTVHLE